MYLKKIMLHLIVICFCTLLVSACNKESDDNQYYIVITISNNVKSCYMKKPGSDERYEGDLVQAKTRDGRENTAWCDVKLPPSFRNKYRFCVLNGLSVDGLDEDSKNNLHSWSCHVGKTISTVSMSMNLNATRAEVLCSMQCM